MHQPVHHAAFLRTTFELARAARTSGNHPFGAALVLDGAVVLTAANAVHTEHDATSHAESRLASAACRALPRADRARAILYASTEPCVMCAGSIYWAGIRSVVFGCSATTLATYATGSFTVPCREIFARGRHATAVTGPLLEDEAAALHGGFWR